MKKFFFAVCFVLLSLAVLPAKDKDRTGEVIARVDTREIKKDEVFKRLYTVNGTNVLGQMIQEILIEEDAKKRKIIVNEKEIEEKVSELKKQFQDEKDFEERLKSSNTTIEELKKEYRKQILTEKYALQAGNITVTGEEIKNFFDVNKEKLARPEQFLVRHILVATTQEANDLLLALNAGADFSLLAKAKSIDSASRDKGGDIGFFSKGMLLPEFENAVFNLEVDKISPVTQTKVGFHIIKLIEKKKAEEARFDEEMRGKIERMLLVSGINEALPGLIKVLADKSKIEILYK